MLYPYGERDKPFKTAKFLTARGTRERDVPDEGNARNEHRYRQLTWAAQSKRQLYTDNLLLNSSPLLQQWVLRTQTNIEYLRLQFLENDQMKRMATDSELEIATRADGTIDPCAGRLFLPDTVINSPAYWKRKLNQSILFIFSAMSTAGKRSNTISTSLCNAIATYS